MDLFWVAHLRRENLLETKFAQGREGKDVAQEGHILLDLGGNGLARAAPLGEPVDEDDVVGGESLLETVDAVSRNNLLALCTHLLCCCGALKGDSRVNCENRACGRHSE